MRTAATRVLLVLASLLLAAGTVAGITNREVLDGSRFAAHADAVRMNDNVAQLVGVAITDRVLEFNENLVALRPAIEAVTVTLVRSSAFTPIVRAAVRQLHEAFTRPGSGQVLLRLSDLTAILVAALNTVAPNIANYLPPDLDVRLADVGGQSFAARTVHLTRVVGLLDWLLPTLALISFGLAIGLARRRQRALALAGVAVAGSGLLVALGCSIAAIVASSTRTDELRGALTATTWGEFGPSYWRSALILVVAGAVVFAAAGAYLPRWSVAAILQRIGAWLAAPGTRPRGQLATGAVLVVLGIAALYRPLATARAIVELIGLTVLAEGIGRISRVSALGRAEEQAEGDERSSAPSPKRWRRWVAPVIAVLTVAGLMSYVAVAATPAQRGIAVAPPQVSDPNACNGHVELCSRRYDDVAYVATHNSMSAADEPGWFIPEQPTGLVGQLDAGVRALLIDTWYGQPTDRSGVIATAGASHDAALAQAQAEYGAAVVDSALRLRSALHLTPHGPVQPYLCHALCELGSTPLVPALQGVRAWLAGHPREVVTFIIEDSITPADTAKAFQQAGLLAYVHTQVAGQPWPTLGTLIASGQRVVAFMQRQGGGAADPWLLKAFDWIQDTPYDNASASALNCARLRGTASNSLLLINNILTRFQTRVSDSEKINAYDALWHYASRCQAERGQLPNFIAVDYYNKGNVFAVVDRLNGFD